MSGKDGEWKRLPKKTKLQNPPTATNRRLSGLATVSGGGKAILPQPIKEGKAQA
jgi:hypothetical protein